MCLYYCLINHVTVISWYYNLLYIIELLMLVSAGRVHQVFQKLVHYYDYGYHYYYHYACVIVVMVMYHSIITITT